MKYDEWIIGEGLESPGRWYVIHTQEPRFLVEIIDEDDPRFLDFGWTWALSNGQIAANPQFWDTPPQGKALDKLILSLGEILDDYDERLDRRIRRDQQLPDEE